MQFHERRRQQFLGEQHWALARRNCLEGVEEVGRILREAVAEGDVRYAMGRARTISELMIDRLTLDYTAGDPVASMRGDLEKVVAAFERYAELLWQYKADRNEPAFDFVVLDDYCQLMQLVGLCFLLHRRDLFPRIAALQDGENGTANGGADVIYEEFMIHVFGADKRFDTEHACQVRPYENLFYALTEESTDKQIKELDLFLKRWYKDLSGTGWHDSHKPNENGEQGGYHGYWSFEAGAAVILLGIEDDSSLHKYLYYPKDLVAWCREHRSLSEPDGAQGIRLRCEADQPCPRDGEWETPAQANSRRRFTQGEVMPSVAADYGQTIWQWVGD
jgi:hypothetical protein